MSTLPIGNPQLLGRPLLLPRDEQPESNTPETQDLLVTRAGVVVVLFEKVRSQSSYYFLMALDERGGYSPEFGGKVDVVDQNDWKKAQYREFTEETCRFFSSTAIPRGCENSLEYTDIKERISDLFANATSWIGDHEEDSRRTKEGHGVIFLSIDAFGLTKKIGDTATLEMSSMNNNFHDQLSSATTMKEFERSDFQAVPITTVLDAMKNHRQTWAKKLNIGWGKRFLQDINLWNALATFDNDFMWPEENELPRLLSDSEGTSKGYNASKFVEHLVRVAEGNLALFEATHYYQLAGELAYLSHPDNAFYLNKEMLSSLENSFNCKPPFKDLHRSARVNLCQKTFLYRAASNGHPGAQFKYAEILEKEGHFTAAKPYYKKAADGGHLDAQFKYAMILEREEDFTGAKSYYKKAADGGRPGAQYKYAGILAIEESPEAARSYYKQAADEGYPDAQFNYAKILAIEESPEAARPYYEQAADGGHPGAQFTYAEILEKEGRLTDAILYYEEAANHNYPQALDKWATLNNLKWNESDVE